MNLGQMIDYCRNLLNERPYTDDVNETAVFWKRSDIVAYLNQSVIHYNAFVNDLDENYNVNYVEYNTSQILNSECLIPSNYQRIKLVELNSNPPSQTDDIIQWVEIKPIDLADKNWVIRRISYLILGNKLKFTADLGANSRVRIWGLERHPELLSDNDICFIPIELHESICINAVVQAALRDKQNTMAAAWQQILNKKDTDARNFIKPRQTQEPATVRARKDWDTGYYGWMQW